MAKTVIFSGEVQNKNTNFGSQVETHLRVYTCCVQGPMFKPLFSPTPLYFLFPPQFMSVSVQIKKKKRCLWGGKATKGSGFVYAPSSNDNPGNNKQKNNKDIFSFPKMMTSSLLTEYRHTLVLCLCHLYLPGCFIHFY